MITIFNRKELTITFSMKIQSEVRETLQANHIEYSIKTINRKSPSPLSAGTRASTGTFGENLDLAYEYIIYVKKQDYEHASYLIR
ncbi:MAG: hypothetical protein R3Y53_08215 [Bacillota bacterium]